MKVFVIIKTHRVLKAEALHNSQFLTFIKGDNVLRNFRLAMLLVAVFMMASMAMYGCGTKESTKAADETATTTMPTSDTGMDGMDSTDDMSGRDTTTAPGTGETMPDVELPTAPKELVDVYFDFDKYDVNASEAAKLDKNALWIKANSNKQIIIEGHCDERGTVAYNLALGERRAMAAKNYLVSLGVPSSGMSIVSYGEERPADPGHNEAAWAKNRRAHFLASVKP
jgi:peptidoglycan-associated lipoprotein